MLTVDPEHIPQHLARHWPFVWIVVPRGSTAKARAAAIAESVRDDDLRDAVYATALEWISLPTNTPEEAVAEHVLINVLDAALDEQDRRDALAEGSSNR